MRQLQMGGKSAIFVIDEERQTIGEEADSADIIKLREGTMSSVENEKALLPHEASHENSIDDLVIRPAQIMSSNDIFPD